jgi:hypothetical protein
MEVVLIKVDRRRAVEHLACDSGRNGERPVSTAILDERVQDFIATDRQLFLEGQPYYQQEQRRLVSVSWVAIARSGTSDRRCQ